jgi:hypothetical protein
MADQLKVAFPRLFGLIEMSESGTAIGPLALLLKDVELATDQKFSMTIHPFKRALRQVETGRADIGVFMRTPGRDKIATPLLKLGETRLLAISLKGQSLKPPNDFNKLSVASLRGGIKVPDFILSQSVSTIEFSNPVQGLKILHAGRFDAMIVPDFLLVGSLESLELSAVILSKPYVINNRSIWAYGSTISAYVYSFPK